MENLVRRGACVLILGVAVVAGGTPAPAAAQRSGPSPSDSAKAWFSSHIESITRRGGRWLTDNGRYRSQDEPWVTYGIEWKKGLSGRTAHGRLFGISEDGREETFWELYSYWDELRSVGIGMQVHVSGRFGTGEFDFTSPSQHELIQAFRMPGGTVTRLRHLERSSRDSIYSESFDWEAGGWVPRRSYIWLLQPAPDR